MTIFRPCLDIDEGQVTVRQYLYSTPQGPTEVHGTDPDRNLKTADYYSNIFKEHNLTGGHIYKHSHNCDEQALAALRAWPGVWSIGGAINLQNCSSWIDAGAAKVILRNEIYTEGNFDEDVLRRISEKVGTDKVVIDVTCRQKGYNDFWVALNRWSSFTTQRVTEDSINQLSSYCSEMLFHPAGMDGKQKGVDTDFIEMVVPWTRVPSTYAGGCKLKQDMVLVERYSNALMDITFGSALDLYGGTGVKLEDLVKWNKQVSTGSHAKKKDAYHRPSLSGDELEAELSKFAASMPELAGGSCR